MFIVPKRSLNSTLCFKEDLEIVFIAWGRDIKMFLHSTFEIILLVTATSYTLCTFIVVQILRNIQGSREGVGQHITEVGPTHVISVANTNNHDVSALWTDIDYMLPRLVSNHPLRHIKIDNMLIIMTMFASTHIIRNRHTTMVGRQVYFLMSTSLH